MPGLTLFNGILGGWFVLAAATFLVLVFVPAPYGRFVREGWGPALPPQVGWLLMELPSAVVFAALYAAGNRPSDPAALAFLILWQVHYLHRSLIYPFRRRGIEEPMPLILAVLGALFNSVNAGLNGIYLFALGPTRGAGWLADPRFLAGLAVFVAGFAVNVASDSRLLRLRHPGESGYSIPRGGLFRRVSCPNYLGEILEWFGWALATWSVAGLSFAVWTAANLVPRAMWYHRWYRQRFPDYPPHRRALVPYLF